MQVEFVTSANLKPGRDPGSPGRTHWKPRVPERGGGRLKKTHGRVGFLMEEGAAWHGVGDVRAAGSPCGLGLPWGHSWVNTRFNTQLL